MSSIYYLSIILAGTYQVIFPGTEIDSFLGFVAMIGTVLVGSMDDTPTNRY